MVSREIPRCLAAASTLIGNLAEPGDERDESIAEAVGRAGRELNFVQVEVECIVLVDGSLNGCARVAERLRGVASAFRARVQNPVDEILIDDLGDRSDVVGVRVAEYQQVDAVIVGHCHRGGAVIFVGAGVVDDVVVVAGVFSWDADDAALSGPDVNDTGLEIARLGVKGVRRGGGQQQDGGSQKSHGA